MIKINPSKPACPLCGKRRGTFLKLSQALQNVSLLLIGLLKVGILLLFLILIGSALIK